MPGARLSPSEIERLSAIVCDLLDAHQDKGWDEAWKGETTPWDAGEPQPALKHVLESGNIDFPRTGRALVIGCGRYGTTTIASVLGLDTLGVYISPTAVEIARRLVNNSVSDRYIEEAGVPDGKIKIEVVSLEGTTFDVIYDYTFFSAWGRQMAKLVKPGGFLITLIFPILPYTEVGPPDYVRPEHYTDALRGRVTLSHVGKERLVLRRKV
ncbi:S-adenosyl-L-methionine-dependent methyltransferase [Fomes fomentarius]|nr:S-adenosyl-L-methionine-dependent methyltransferase [Fomes fomentarius]